MQLLTQKEKDSLLICEFMDGKLVDWFAENIIIMPWSDGITMQNYSSKSKAYILDLEIHFDTSWDFLMPVVDKIESLGYTINMLGKKDAFVCLIRELNMSAPIAYVYYGAKGQEDLAKTKIEATYKAVIQFINWYNENGKHTD